MRIIGFNFTKIKAEKHKDLNKDLKISNKIDVLSVGEVKQDVLKAKEEMVAIKFSFTIDYAPGIATVSLEGNVILALTPDLAKETIKKWKNKETPDELKIPLFNMIFRKAGLKALELEDELNLPLHMQMPLLKRKEDSK